MYKLEIQKGYLRFINPATTSRGTYLKKEVYYLILRSSTGKVGVGECAPLPDLNPDFSPHYEEKLKDIAQVIEREGIGHLSERYREFPSILFGIETALQNMGKGWLLYDTPFSRGESSITINGLVWMGSHEEMLRRIEEKLSQGVSCLKLKIGAIEFQKELSLIAGVRERFGAEDLEIRLDANGAFKVSEAMERLKRLSTYQIHSIEQPIKAGQWQEMARLVEESPIPIALDEELIGVYTREKKQELLETIRPHYIILKPTLHGALSGCDEWVRLAEEKGTAWWATSALESNIGLNAIAQWVSTYHPRRPQGLGTGKLYRQNVPSPIQLEGSALSFSPERAQELPPPEEAVKQLAKRD